MSWHTLVREQSLQRPSCGARYKQHGDKFQNRQTRVRVNRRFVFTQLRAVMSLCRTNFAFMSFKDVGIRLPQELFDQRSPFNYLYKIESEPKIPWYLGFVSFKSVCPADRIATNGHVSSFLQIVFEKFGGNFLPRTHMIHRPMLFTTENICAGTRFKLTFFDYAVVMVGEFINGAGKKRPHAI
jgi:hypothetical protein